MPETLSSSESLEVSDSEKVVVEQNLTPSQAKLPLKTLLLGLLIVVLLGGLGYKWNEWQTLNAFAQMHNEYVSSELEVMDQMNDLAQEMRGDEPETDKDEEPSDEEIEAMFESGGADVQKKFDEAKNDYAFFNEKYTEYENMLKDHQAGYSDFTNTRLKFIPGQRADQIKKVASAMNDFYTTELADVQHNRVGSQLGFNISEVQKDMFLLQVYSVNTAGFLDDDAVSENFNDISSLEKYGREDFKFEKEDEIKQQHPYGYESLQKFRNYLKTSYSAIKDVVAGNFDSAGYKFSRLGEETADLGTIDDERLEDEGKDERIERKRKLVEALLARYEVILALGSSDESDLPIIGNVKDWNQELLACQAYIYKADLYEEVREKYPEAKDLEGFVKEMNQVSPKTDSVENSVNKDLVSLVNDDKKIEFTCKSEDGDEYTLTYEKDTEEDKDQETKDKE